MNFTIIQGLAPIKYLCCGPNHMLAISDFNSELHDLKDGSTYAWGRNHKGQLGIGSKDDSNLPRKVILPKERFKKV